ncbi:MAG TPA: ABC transporter ATP-binding protein [Beijerinckiaceae bacterium]|jgi:ABC-2 type transport system ATP-binding protein|nr:ABC transporter ATP-binding protein [Beijerinckiaceae bacterium]
MAAAPALEAREVSHRFGARQALADVSLTVPQGRFVALLGPNGAGKTTFFSIVTRLYASRSGSVRIFGHDLARAASLALAELGVVFQSRTLDLDLSLGQNLSYHAALHGLAGPEVHAHIAALIGRAGLAERIDEKVRSLSGGQARRVEIARALVHRPRLLLLDEPTVGLDRASRADIVATVRRLVAEEGLSVLWATHLFDEVEPEDEVYVLHRGRVVAHGNALTVIAAAGESRSLEEAYRMLTAEPEAEAA